MDLPAYYPGTESCFTGGVVYRLFSVTNGITLSQVCEITGLERNRAELDKGDISVIPWIGSIQRTVGQDCTD